MTKFVLRADTVVTLGSSGPHFVGIDGDHIVSVSTEAPEDCVSVIDLGDATIIPGLIDIHIHGREGRDVMDADPEALAVISKSLSQHGVTGFLATTVTSTWERTLDALNVVAETDGNALPGARMLGAYSEGVFFNVRHKGAHNENFFMEPSVERVAELIDAAQGKLKILALAPEIPGAMESIAYATSHGVRAVLGHTDASYAEAKAALDAGGCGGVHVFNGMRGIHHREPGCAGAVLLEPGTVEVIADGVHLHPAILELITRLKSTEDILLISDCMCAGGLDDGEYRLGEMDVLVEQGVVRTEAGGLAGSTLTLDRAVHNMADSAGISVADAIQMASLSPARFLGLDKELGSIEAGKKADIAILDASGAVVATMVGGRLTFNNGEWEHAAVLKQHIN